jgi:lipopolysaccharide biosynthesis regulator YciM
LEPALLRELLALLATVHENLDGDEAFAGLLARAIESRPDPKVLRAYVDFLIKNGLEYQPEVLLDHIRRQPSLAHVPFLLELSQHADPAVADRIRLTIARVAARDDIYQCVDCGYKSPRHTWHCPTCRMWGSFAPSYETRTGAQSKPLPTPIE